MSESTMSENTMKQATLREGMTSQGATVVIPTLNRGGFLRDCIVDLLAQEYAPLEILVVDQSASVPAEVETLVAANRDRVSYFRVTFRGLPEARNFGWQHARYDAVIFVDDDVRMPPNFVGEHMRSLSEPRVGLVGGGVVEPKAALDAGPPTGTFDTWRAVPQAGFAALGEHDADHAKGCNFSAWRHALREVGGIDERLNVGAALYEELEMCLRLRKAGYRIVFNGNARLTHLVAPSGGCRVDQVESYVRALSHNRAMLIRRNLPWYKAATATARLMVTGAAFARRYREPRALRACVEGFVAGVGDAALAPKCTTFGAEVIRDTAAASGAKA